jgi:hypothetical protein
MEGRVRILPVDEARSGSIGIPGMRMGREEKRMGDEGREEKGEEGKEAKNNMGLVP